MAKKNFKKNLKCQKGISAADTLIALLIILMSINIIGMIYVNLNSTARLTYKKAGAVRIATNLIENIKGVYFDRVQTTGEIEGGNNQSIFNTKIPNGYKVNIITEDFYEDTNDLVKKVTVQVIYNPNNDNDDVVLSTIIEREPIRECNSPNFSDNYIKSLVGVDGDNPNEYMMYEPSTEMMAVTDKKIVCPIRFNGENYVVVSGNDLNGIWYSYSSKQWARVLVFDDYDDLKNYVDIGSNIVYNISILKSETKSFVWVPRYRYNNDTKDFDSFMYKDTNYAINKHSEDNKNYNYIQSSNETLNNAYVYPAESMNGSPKVGQWYQYSYIKNINASTSEPVKILYNSDYGPLFEF